VKIRLDQVKILNLVPFEVCLQVRAAKDFATSKLYQKQGTVGSDTSENV
jgi:hypothetical protein